ncbi:MAG: IS607 family transposase [Pasteurella sp.]|nr:IS607 family transposase [Pasteurella sp.]
MNRLLTISEVAEELNVSISTLRRWDKDGTLVAERTPKGHRRYKQEDITSKLGIKKANLEKQKRTIAYTRVSSHDQKADLQRQIEMLEMFCVKNGWTYEIISDLGSGINYNKKGLNKLLNLLLDEQIERLVITHKDRLLRFGAELIFKICKQLDIEVVIINQGKESSFEEELTKDILEIMTVFSAKLYGRRSHKNKKFIQAIKDNL